MDTKNVLMAIVLSTVVLIFWATFFEAPIVVQQEEQSQTLKNENSSTPSIEEIETSKEISRIEAIGSVDRVKLENNNIIGSISLEGGMIDVVARFVSDRICFFGMNGCMCPPRDEPPLVVAPNCFFFLGNQNWNGKTYERY